MSTPLLKASIIFLSPDICATRRNSIANNPDSLIRAGGAMKAAADFLRGRSAPEYSAVRLGRGEAAGGSDGLVEARMEAAVRRADQAGSAWI